MNNQLVLINNNIAKAANVKHGIVQKILNEIDASLPELIPYRKGDKWGFCDRNKRIVIECVYDFVEKQRCFDITFFSNGVALSGNVVIPNTKSVVHYINKKGKVIYTFSITSDNWTTDIHPNNLHKTFHFGLGRVRVDNKWGFIDADGNIVVDFIYDEIEVNWYKSNIIKARVGDNTVYFDKQNRKYDEAQWEKDCEHRIDKKAFETLKEFLENPDNSLKNSNPSIESKSSESTIKYFDGMRMITDKNLVGFVDVNEKRIIDCIYEEAKDFNSGLAKVKYKGKDGYIDKRGNQYWED